MSIVVRDIRTNHMKGRRKLRTFHKLPFLGVIVNSPSSRSEREKRLEEKLKQLHPEDKHVHKVKVLHEVNSRAANLYDKFGADTLLCSRVAAVTEEDKRGGLASALALASVALANVLGFKAVKAEATGAFSRVGLEKLLFRVESEYFYEEYACSRSGARVFADMGPHKCCTLLSRDANLDESLWL